nr:hypothetical protein [Morchella crassipes]
MRRKRRAGRREGGSSRCAAASPPPPAGGRQGGAAEQVYHIYMSIYIIKPNSHPHSGTLCGWGEGRVEIWEPSPSALPLSRERRGGGMARELRVPLAGSAGFSIYICLYI